MGKIWTYNRAQNHLADDRLLVHEPHKIEEKKKSVGWGGGGHERFVV
jgi:hypothetical protein